MKLWRRNKNVEKELPSFLRVGLMKFNQRLIRIANFLQQRTNNYSVRKKKILLFVFTLVFITESMIVLVQSFKRSARNPIAVSRIKTVTLPKDEDKNFLITKIEFLKIQKFKSYMDSLSTTPNGSKFRDSLLQNRPHLMDTVNFLIRLYLQNSKLKQ